MGRETQVKQLVVAERHEVKRFGRAAVAARALGPGWATVPVDSDRPVSEWFDQRPADVVIVVVAPDGDGFDRYDVVSRVAELHAQSEAGVEGAPRPVVIAATTDVNPLLDIRLIGAGADLVTTVDNVARSDGGSFASIVHAAVQRARRGPVDDGTPAGERAQLAGTDPAAVLAYVSDQGIESAFRPGSSQAEVGLSRRGIMRVRRDLAELGGIRPSLQRYTGGLDRRIELPTWREVVAYVNCARGEVDWGDDAWGHGAGPRIGRSRYGAYELVSVARELIA